MARLTGPDNAERLCYVLRSDNAISTAAGLPAVVYSDAGGTMLADIRTTGGVTIPSSQLTVDATSLLPLFQYPDSVTTVYVSVNGGPVSPVRATIGSGSGGGIAGPGTSTTNALTRYSDTTGAVVKNSGVTLDDNADLVGLRRLTRTLSADPAVAGYERWDLNYAVSTSSSDLWRSYVSSVLTCWRNEVGFLRGTPHAGYKDDAVVRGIARSDLTSQTGGWLELQENSRTYVTYKRDWFGSLWRGNGTANPTKMADVLVLGPAAPVPTGTPAGTVIVRTAT